jgi:hypothetical protein
MIQTTNEKVRALRNNDPLAHVYLLLDSYDGQLAEHRMYTEFITDIGERLVDQPFRSTYTYTYDENEITYDTGLQYVASLEQSYRAAVRDVEKGRFSSYHLDRQNAFKAQGDVLLDWLHTEQGSSHVLLVSLCPSREELSYEEATKQNFKPDRMMASVQLHTKDADGSATTTAFSLDGLSLSRLQDLLQELGIEAQVATTTLEQVTIPIYIDSADSADSVTTMLIDTYDMLLHKETQHYYKQGASLEKNIVEANAYVAAHPEAYTLYKTIVEHVTTSLKMNIVSASLANYVAENLAKQYANYSNIPSALCISEGDVLTVHTAGELIEYVRERAIPEYLTGLLSKNSHVSESSYYDIGSAGVSAAQSGRVYAGACPSSTNSSEEQTAIDQATQFGLNTVVTQESPKPLFTVGNFAVIPIGSCPASCKTECGIGIKDMRSGSWYCANSKRCSGYSADIYNIVFKPGEVQNSRENNGEYLGNDFTERDRENTHDVSYELQQTQQVIWQLRTLMFDETIDDLARNKIVRTLVDAHSRKQHLLRVALGSEAYVQAEDELVV